MSITVKRSKAPAQTSRKAPRAPSQPVRLTHIPEQTRRLNKPYDPKGR